MTLASVAHLADALTAIRLSLHVLAAATWVGGQIVMLGLVGEARGIAADAPKRLARAFNTVAWPAFAVLVATGFWNAQAVGKGGTAWNAVFGVKMTLVLLAGLGAYLHTRATSKAQLAIWGSISGIASVGALVCGVLLAG